MQPHVVTSRSDVPKAQKHVGLGSVCSFQQSSGRGSSRLSRFLTNTKKVNCTEVAVCYLFSWVTQLLFLLFLRHNDVAWFSANDVQYSAQICFSPDMRNTQTQIRTRKRKRRERHGLCRVCTLSHMRTLCCYFPTCTQSIRSLYSFGWFIYSGIVHSFMKM